MSDELYTALLLFCQDWGITIEDLKSQLLSITYNDDDENDDKDDDENDDKDDDESPTSTSSQQEGL